MLNIGMPYEAIDAEVRALAERHGNDPEAVLEIFQALQGKYGGLTEQQIQDTARCLGISAGKAFGVASFYSMLSTEVRAKQTIRVCDGPACWLEGAGGVLEATGQSYGNTCDVERTSCLGLCDRAPAALIDNEQCGPLTLQDVSKIESGWRGQPRSYANPLPGEVRFLLDGCGKIDPRSLSSALDYGAYEGLQKAMALGGSAVIAQVSEAGLRGRGGAGFPVGMKWRMVAEQPRMPKYVVCNADESEPLVFKDRVLIETNPHQILEGMLIAAYAVGATEGFIYIRGEYERQAQLLEEAIRQAKEAGYAGERVLGTDFSFEIHLHRGAGAYICGEETALLNSLEGKRGEPRLRPPYPTVSGYHGLPTVVNNVETFASGPGLFRRGLDWFRTLGNPDIPGTKLYTLSGHVKRIGLFEAPYRLTLRQIIDEFGGGMREGAKFGFALSGGAAGLIVPPDLLDVPIDYQSTSKGVALGAGAFLVCDETVSPVAVVRELLHFFEMESCGFCTPCRIGTQQARLTLERIAERPGNPQDIRTLRELAGLLSKDSFCGLGQSSSWPIKSALEHFLPAFENGK